MRTVLSISHGFDKKFSRFLNQREQDKMPWVQDPNQNNVDN
jgi:hypothetical protein